MAPFSAAVLRERYFVEYGLSIRGMIQHHDVDPVDFGKTRHFEHFNPGRNKKADLEACR
jgi:hypothetical protein